MSDSEQCALWYWSHGFPGYTLYDDEAAAVHAAVWMADDGDSGFPAGIQRADGTYTPLEEWTAYEAEQDRLMKQAVESVRVSASQPRPITRTIRPPFETRDAVTVEVPGDAPSWLGSAGRGGGTNEGSDR